MSKFIKTLLLTLGSVLFLWIVIILLFESFNYGIVLISAISCLFIVYGLFYEKLILIKWLTYSTIALCSSYLAMMLFIGIYGRNDNVTYNEDAAIVLGAAIRGEQVSLLLSNRLDKALEYSEKNPNAIIIVSGGQGPGEDISEALAMERFLIAKGLPKERIIKEEASISSYENILYSGIFMDNLFDGPCESVIITSDFHIFRAVKIAKQLGLNTTHIHAKTKWNYIPLNYSRECMAILWLLIIGNGTAAAQAPFS